MLEVEAFEFSGPGYSLTAVNWMVMRRRVLADKAAVLREAIVISFPQNDRGRTNFVGVGWLIEVACDGLDR